MRCAATTLLLGLSLAGCTTSPASTASGGAPTGFIVLTAGGSALTDGQADVPPTLDLGLAGDGVSTDTVAVHLDGHELSLTPGSDGVHARVAPLAFASDHKLEVDVSGRPPQTLAFRIVDATGVSAAAWIGADGRLGADVVFERPPDKQPLDAALAPGQPAWLDPTHLRLHWQRAPTSLDVPAGLKAARGSLLAGPLHLDLGGLGPGQFRRTTVPAAAPAPAQLDLTVWTTSSAGSHASTRAHASRATVLSPTGWIAGADGGLNGAPDAVTLRVATAAGRSAWPLLANDTLNPEATSQLLRDPAARARLITAVVGEVQRRHLGGIHLDFEAVSGDDRDLLSSFVTDLAGGLHRAGARLAVDVVPHRPGHVNSASAAYDDLVIATAADRIVLLAYDQHTQPGDPGPVAGLDWQSQEMAGSLAGLPYAKVILGLPLYARRWSADSVSSPTYLDAVTQALGEPDLAYDYSFAAASPVLRTRPGGVPTQVWFDDADSLLRKIAPAARLGLGGIAAWRAGQEDPAFWTVV